MTYRTGMIYFHQDYLAPGLATFLLVFMCYLAGRVHQFFKQTQEREQAYREGYNHATRSLFSLATKTVRTGPPGSTSKDIKMRPGYASVPVDARSPVPARHRASGRRKPNLDDTKRFTDWPDAPKAA